MKIEGRKGGKVCTGTVRRTNYKNIEAIGKSGIEKMEKKGVQGLMKKKNFHQNIGGKKGQSMKEDLYAETHEDLDEQLFEAEEELNLKKPQRYKQTKEEKSTLKMVNRMLSTDV